MKKLKDEFVELAMDLNPDLCTKINPLDEAAEDYYQKLKCEGSKDQYSTVCAVFDFKAGAIWAEKHSLKVLALVEALEEIAKVIFVDDLPEEQSNAGLASWTAVFQDVAREALANFRKGDNE